MELIATLLVAFPLGYFVHRRLAAYVAFVAVHSFLFTFQSTELTWEWVGGTTHSFPQDAHAGGCRPCELDGAHDGGWE